MKYQINIGQIYDIEAGINIPYRTIVINEAQRNIILLFANKRINELGYPVYSINGCEFEILIYLEDEPYYKQKIEEMEQEHYERRQNK